MLWGILGEKLIHGGISWLWGKSGDMRCRRADIEFWLTLSTLDLGLNTVEDVPTRFLFHELSISSELVRADTSGSLPRLKCQHDARHFAEC